MCRGSKGHPHAPPRCSHQTPAGVEPVPSKSAVSRLLKRQGLIGLEARNRRNRRSCRWELGAATELWQTDVVGDASLADGTQAKILIGIQDHSWFVVWATRRAVYRTFAGATEALGLRKRCCLKTVKGPLAYSAGI